jgi:hypothetical protein
MPDKYPLQKGVRKSLIAIRFVLFGVGGFIVMFWFSLDFFLRLSEPYLRQTTMNPFASLPLAFVGALMTLFGVGELKRWAYLWVFASMPASFFLLALMPNSVGDSKEMGVVFPFVGAMVSYAVVRGYYRRQDAQNMCASLETPSPSAGSVKQE